MGSGRGQVRRLMAVRRDRVSRSVDFARIYKHGTSKANKYVVLYALARDPADNDGIRLGVSASLRVGGSVKTKRIKRVLREAFWGVAAELPRGYDYVLIARVGSPETIEATKLSRISDDILRLRDRLGLAPTSAQAQAPRPQTRRPRPRTRP